MLLTESYWYKDIIEKHVKQNSLVLILGSSSKTFREIIQPYIYQNVYLALEKKNCNIVNVDLKEEEGVDISVDITKKEFIAKLQIMKADLIICSNLLEHIIDRDIFIDSVSAILKKDGMLIASVPYSYPYHSDPIDTLYRPTVSKLGNDFKMFQMLNGEIVKSGMLYNIWYKKDPNYQRFLLLLVASIRRILSLDMRKINLAKWLFIETSVTCCLFVRK